jgi:hypothetical protein
MPYATVFLAPDENLRSFSDSCFSTGATREMALILATQYTKIGTIETDKTGEAAAEEMFDLSNNPSRDEERQLRWGQYRSLSVGDVVHVDNEGFVCCSTGWQKL